MDETLKNLLKTHEITLKDNLFITGSEPSCEDAIFYKTLIDANYKPSKKEYPSIWAWYSLMVLFEDEVIIEWIKTANSETQNKNGSKKECKKENKEKKVNKIKEAYICDIPDNCEEKPEYLEKIKEDINKHKNEKSNVFLEINPESENEGQDLDVLAKKIMKEIKRDGLKWSEKYEIKEIGFKIKKLIMGMNVGNETSVQDIIDQLETWEEEIQSVDFALFSQC